MQRDNTTVFCFAQILLGMVMLSSCAFVPTQSKFRPLPSREAQIVVNQIGYYAPWPKIALLLNAQTTLASSVAMIDASSGLTLLQLTPGIPTRDEQSGDLIQEVDFSTVRTAGRYYLRLDTTVSIPFEISNNPHEQPLRIMLRSFYLQRCGIGLNDTQTGLQHDLCHGQDGRVARTDSSHLAGDEVRAAGGWHDAGDYGKYIATTAVTVGRLLSLYEQHPYLFTDGQLAIPESRNGVADILDEARVGIEWMLTMQRADGATYRKLSGAHWPLKVAPDLDTQPRFLYGISTAETAKFAAATALAARVYAPIDPTFTQRCRQAAEQAWRFLQQNPEMTVDWTVEDDRGSGKYLFSDTDQEASLRTDITDRFWAATELWLATGQSLYRRYIMTHFAELSFSLFEWKDPSALGMTNLWWHAKHRLGEDDLTPQIATKLIARADRLLEKVAQSGYRLANHRFVWGSNKMVAEEGITLVFAHRLTGNLMYLHAALAQVDYLFGRNHFNQTFVTGIGTRPVRHIAHIFARTKEVAIPGLAVGGPNDLAQCNIAPKHQGPLSYIDHNQSYSTNENAIDYNASFIALLGMLLAETQGS